MRVTLLILLLPLLAACQSPATISATGGDVPRAPTADKPTCSADAAAAIASEPLPPAGVSRAAVVAALIDGETTLKRYIVRDGQPYLKAENPNFPDLVPVTELLVQGVMVALIRHA